MIWQVPEIWEILEIMEMAGISIAVSGGLFIALTVFLTQGITYCQEDSSKPFVAGKFLTFIFHCWKRSGKVAIWSSVTYTFLIFLLCAHPDFISFAQQ